MLFIIFFSLCARISQTPVMLETLVEDLKESNWSGGCEFILGTIDGGANRAIAKLSNGIPCASV